ncbi:SAM-dependent methyltransferase [Luteolibacter sp. AS25]|uniref:SAM-dependent methyltransferase n=1 Tax=Luteolibacter sp. AS25 TaxID=3135776 RepID=UPI00398A57D0
MSDPITTHLIRISEVFADLIPDILEKLGAEKWKKLGPEYFLIDTANATLLRDGPAAKFIRFQIQVKHSWPCNPEKMDSFIEKAAQATYYKCESYNPQTILVGRLDTSSTKNYYKALASNFRGRALQVFELPESAPKSAEEQDPDKASLFCFVGKGGLFCGMSTPREAGGLHPGGTKYISQNSEDTISRAGAKVAEALHYLAMFRAPLPKYASWLELGASPGGMTSELLKRNYSVTAIDRAALDVRLANHLDLKVIRDDVAAFIPPKGIRYDAILSDMNGPAKLAITNVTRLVDFLKPGGLVITTLKTTGASSVEEIDELEKDVLKLAKEGGLTLITKTHLTYNRQEFTLFFEKV